MAPPVRHRTRPNGWLRVGEMAGAMMSWNTIQPAAKMFARKTGTSSSRRSRRNLLPLTELSGAIPRGASRHRDDSPRGTGDSMRGSRFRLDRELGQPSGCWAIIFLLLGGRHVGKSTSWKALARNHRRFMAPCTALGTQERAHSLEAFRSRAETLATTS